MGFGDAIGGLSSYRARRIGELLGETPSTWFTSGWSSLSEMLDAFKSDDENKEISSGYAQGAAASKVPANLKLDYVCSLRRDVRKQYISAEGDVFTDVTPFRHGAFSAHGARIFDSALEQIVKS